MINRKEYGSKEKEIKIIQNKMTWEWNNKRKTWKKKVFYENTLKTDNLSVKINKKYSVYLNKLEVNK